MFFEQIRHWADHPGRDQNRSPGVPFFKELLLSDRNATTIYRMHSNDLEACGKKCCYSWFLSEVKFFIRFDVVLDFVIFASLNAFSIDYLVASINTTTYASSSYPEQKYRNASVLSAKPYCDFGSILKSNFWHVLTSYST